MTHLKLKGVHLCCGGCVDAVATALESVPVATFQCDMENGTVTLTAEDDVAAQKALDAIAAAGLHGETGNERLKMKAEPNIPPGKVRRLRVSGIHNCCQPCCEAIKGAARSVEGVTSDTTEPGETAFEVRGNFSAAELVRALNAAGFHAKVKE
jgi:periplasmic mercuric ion binding protein